MRDKDFWKYHWTMVQMNQWVVYTDYLTLFIRMSRFSKINQTDIEEIVFDYWSARSV